jgi:hypothetical protein
MQYLKWRRSWGDARLPISAVAIGFANHLGTRGVRSQNHPSSCTIGQSFWEVVCPVMRSASYSSPETCATAEVLELAVALGSRACGASLIGAILCLELVQLTPVTRAVNRSTNGSALFRERREAVEDPAEDQVRDAFLWVCIQVHGSKFGSSRLKDRFMLCLAHKTLTSTRLSFSLSLP